MHIGLDKKSWAAEKLPFFPAPQPPSPRRGAGGSTGLFWFLSPLHGANEGCVNTTCCPRGAASSCMPCMRIPVTQIPIQLLLPHSHLALADASRASDYQIPHRPSRWGSQAGSVRLTHPLVQLGAPWRHMDALPRASWHAPGPSALPADGRAVTRRSQATRTRGSAICASDTLATH